MAQAIKVTGSEWDFSPVCVVCLQPAPADYTVERMLVYGVGTSQAPGRGR